MQGKRFSSSDDRRELELEAVLPPVDEDDVHRSRTLATVAEPRGQARGRRARVRLLPAGRGAGGVRRPRAPARARQDRARHAARALPGDRRSTAKARDVADGRAWIRRSG
ncbi:hypothetical protein [Clavibacter tessellarius]|uniref:hypothetical protein n=1 Tax=Clavibacter tessellarius TaxID=31965 RepID=UPI003245EABD